MEVWLLRLLPPSCERFISWVATFKPGLSIGQTQIFVLSPRDTTVAQKMVCLHWLTIDLRFLCWILGVSYSDGLYKQLVIHTTCVHLSCFSPLRESFFLIAWYLIYISR